MGIFSFLFEKNRSEKPEKEIAINPKHMVIGMPLMVYDGERPVISGLLHDVRENGIILRRNNAGESMAVCKQGTPVSVRGYDGTNPFLYAGTVNRSTEEYCTIENMREQTGRELPARGDYRLHLKRQISICDSPDTVLRKPIFGEMMDISAGGIRFRAEREFYPGTHLYLRVQLRPDQEAEELAGTVIRIRSRETYYEYAVRFDPMETAVRDRLIRTIFALDTERRAFRHNRGK